MDKEVVDPPESGKSPKSILKNGVPKEGTYPESVVRVSAMLSEARRSPPAREPANIDTSPPSSSGSDYSSPVGSPTSPSISCGQHSCGSLFARCAQHGRSQLLQTFTDPESQLSRSTFVNRSVRPQRSSSYHDVFRSSSFRNYIYLRRCSKPKKVQTKFNFDRDSVARLKDDAEKIPKIGLRKHDPREELKPLIVRRHHSLPNSRLHQDALSDLNRIFRDGVYERCATPAGREDAIREAEVTQREVGPSGEDEKCGRQNRRRSNSESKIKTGTKRFSGGKKSAGSEGGVVTGHERDPSEPSDILPRPVNYLILDSSSDEETDQENGDELVKQDQYSYIKYSMGNGVMCRGSLGQDHGDYMDIWITMLLDIINQVVDVTGNGLGVNSHFFHEDAEYLRAIVPRLKKEAREWENKADALETEALSLRRELKKRDQENVRLQREVHKLRSVLQQQTSYFKQEGDLLTSLQDSHGMPGQTQQVLVAPNPNKKQGVSGESSDHGKNLDQIQIERFDKDFRSKQLIKDAIMENDFLKNLDSSQVREIVESMFPKEFPRGSYVLREGEAGSHLYVSAEGELEVIKEDKVLGIMGPGKAFGELAILYNCRRTASIRVVTDAKVWVLDRRVFQQIMMRTGLQRLQENINFLRSVPLLHKLSNDVLAKIADVLEVEFFPSGAHIIRQGASGDTFFIISGGSVKVTQRLPGRREEEEIRTLNKGDYFGEQALLKEDCRTATVIALSPGVECLTLDRDSFIQLIGDLSELHEKDYGDQIRGLSRPSSAISILDEEEYNYIRLDDLDVIATLGVGGFGRVELVQYMYDRSLTFALKCMKKQHIVDTQQQEHVYSEKNIMMACNSPFICRLYRTFRDSKYVYMLLEACLGGEVWTILRDRGCFDDHTTKFVTGCVLEAFEYLHARGIIYRDLKPENLLLDTMGYVKIVDFGFSKRLGFSSKTWTFCGTPEYVAPEIILNKGHDRAVDYWSLGVLMHELLTGTPPFTATDPMKTYNIILKGIDMIDFPKHITRTAQSLIKKLCRDSPAERLGYQRGGIQGIKKHKWFQGFDWDGLKQRALVAPITPQVRSPTDTSNFDSYPKELDLPPDEFSNWDADF